MQQVDHIPIEEMDLFKMYVEVADKVWDIVEGWVPLAQDTVGKQLIRAADSVGANLVEGDGRYGDADALHFLVIARASAREARYWLGRASQRRLLAQERADELIHSLVRATQLLNGLIRYRRQHARERHVKESRSAYGVITYDPFYSE